MSGSRLPLLLTLALSPVALANVQAPEASGDEASGDDADALPTITISAPRLKRSLYDTPAAGVFLQAELGLTDDMELSAGVRHDRGRITIDDRFLADGRDDSELSF